MAQILQEISEQDYLTGELSSNVKHEFVAGFVYAMVGGTNSHNAIATDVLISIGTQLKGKACQPFNSDTKIRIQLDSHIRYYYPDVSIVCAPNPIEDTFQDQPVLIIEVLSDCTRRTDMGKKKTLICRFRH